MKKFLLFFCLAITFSSCRIEISDAEKARRTANRQSTQAQLSAQSAVDVPDLSYFQERRTIAKWAKHWDRPSAACYVYLISYGNIIGYYVSDGKPASTGSFLTPEYSQTYREGGVVEQQLPDIDGTYGTNNQGIRFFTASGVAVEWAGSGASYIYSDIPLNLNVPLLGN
jgi:hypothetical protein